jgi:uncharacterized membrane protein YccC
VRLVVPSTANWEVLYFNTMIRRGYTRRALHDARTASKVAHVRPAYAAGVRAAIATVAPLVFAPLIPRGASWMSLAGLNSALLDRGGPYRVRAVTMSTLAAASAVAALIGSIVSGHLWLSVVVTFAIAMLCGLARAWTDVGPGFGVTILVTYAVALAIPVSTTGGAFVRAAYVVAGGLWAMLLAIILWPISPYRPVRQRIAECYRAVARYLEAATDDLGEGGSFDPAALTSHVVAVRTAIESARGALAVSRRGQAGESGRGERLLVLHEIADQIFAHLIALLEESVAVADASSTQAVRQSLMRVLEGISSTGRSIATAIESETDDPRISLDWNGATLRPDNPFIADIVDRIVDYATAATVLIAALNSAHAPALGDTSIEVAEAPPEPVLFSLAAVIRPSSLVQHHALRVAIVTTVAVLITGLLHLNHGYWVTLTVVAILQPYAATTRQKALQRVAGTILGGIVAAALSALFHNAVAVLVLVALFTMLCVALLPLNYAAYAVFGTPAFVLLAEASAGNWHLAGLRIMNTLIGGALALVGSELLWPGDERSNLPELAAAAIRANDALLRRVMALLASVEPIDLGVLRDARRDVASAALDAEESFQRLMSEHRGPPEALEPIMAFLVYTRRIAASTAALALTANTETIAPAELKQFDQATHDVLTDLAGALRRGDAPAPFPPIGSIVLPTASTAPVVSLRLTRLARQLRLIHDAVARWMSPGDEPKVRTLR